MILGSHRHPVSAKDLLLRQDELPRFLSLGDKKLDEVLGGGIAVNMVTEIAGEAGAGKTQFCLTLATQAQLPIDCGGLNGKVCYLSCQEGDFPSRRMQDIGGALEAKLKRDGISWWSEKYTAKCMLDNVFTSMIYNTDDLADTLRKDVPALVVKDNVRLVIIDSIAGVVRPEYHIGAPQAKKADDSFERAKLLMDIGDLARDLARRPGVAVVIVNQISSYIRKDHQPVPGDKTRQFDNGEMFTMRDAGLLPGDANTWLPCLGPTWSIQVHARLLLVRDSSKMRATHASTDGLVEETKSDVRIDSSGSGSTSNKISGGLFSRRALFIEFSPCQASAQSGFEICAEGIRAASL